MGLGLGTGWGLVEAVLYLYGRFFVLDLGDGLFSFLLFVLQLGGLWELVVQWSML